MQLKKPLAEMSTQELHELITALLDSIKRLEDEIRLLNHKLACTNMF